MVGCTNQPLKLARYQSRGESSSLVSERKHHFFVSLARGFRQEQKARLSHCCGTRGAGEGQKPMMGAQEKLNVKNLMRLDSLEKEGA